MFTSQGTLVLSLIAAQVNLGVAELTTLERDQHVARWIELSETRVLAQLATKPLGGRPATEHKTGEPAGQGKADPR